jgi:hypothetical protein
MYVERNGRPAPRDPWSYRQTGSYQKFNAAKRCSQIVLLHPNNEAISQTRLAGHAESLWRSDLANHPLNVHLVIVSSYLVNWQEYIESLASELEQIVRVNYDVHNKTYLHNTATTDRRR